MVTRMKTIDLGEDGTRALIECIKAKPCLWNTSDPSYKKKILQAKLWVALSNDFGVPVRDLKHKWASLQSSFRHFWIKYNRDETSNPYFPFTRPSKRWYLYDDLLFLASYNKKAAPVKKEPPTRVVLEDDLSTERAPDLDDPLATYPDEIEPTESSSSSLSSATSNANQSITQVGEKLQPDMYTETKVFQTKLTYGESRLDKPSDVPKVISKLVRVGSSYNDALRYGHNVGKVLAQWSPRRRQAATIRIDEILLEMEKVRYREHYGTDP